MRSSQKWAAEANRFTFDNYEVAFTVDAEGLVTVLGIELADVQVRLLAPVPCPCPRCMCNASLQNALLLPDSQAPGVGEGGGGAAAEDPDGGGM